MNTSFPVSEPGPRRGRQALTPEEMAKHVAAFRHSGMSVAAFARQEGLSYYVLRGWRQRAKRVPWRHAPGPRFQTVPLNSLLSQAWAAEVVGPTGVTVRLSGQVPPALVLQLMALTSRPC